MHTRQATIPGLAIAATVLALGCVIPSHSAPDTTDQVAYVKGSTALVPVRFIFEWLGAGVSSKKGEVTAKRAETTVRLKTGSTTATVNGKSTKLAAAPVLIDGKLYVPLRFVAEAFGAGVAYNAKAATVTVTQAGRSVSLAAQPVGTGSAGSPVEIGLSVLRSFMLTQYPGAYKSGRCILIDAAANPWMQREYPGDQLLGDNAGTPRSRLGKDPRFVEAMRKAGGRVGDGWGPYEVERNPSQVRIRLLQWNGGTYVNVVRKQGRWTAEYVEEDGEGYEVDGPARWRVSGGSGKWRFSKQR